MKRVILWALWGMGCAGGGGVTDGSGVTDGTEPECAIDERDCAGECFGNAVEDDCGRCDDDPSNDCMPFAVVNGSWSCEEDTTCQDVWEVDLPGSSDVTIKVRDVSGDSVLRLGAFAPNSRPGGVNVLVGRNKDLACWAPDEDAERTFRAPERGTWRIVVGRDGSSDGMFGAYTLEVESKRGVTLGDEPLRDDEPSLAVGTRCGNEYTFEAAWDCNADESCQDVYEVTLDRGALLDLQITELGEDSAAGLALYEPGDRSGDTNLLTNTRNDRVCDGAGDNVVAPPFEITDDGTYTVTATRDADSSSGARGRYTIAIGADAFFDKPEPQSNDVRTAAPGTQCDWSFSAAADWSCNPDESCQDVYEIGLTEGSSIGAIVRNVTGSSVVRAALFDPGAKLSGINRYTDDTTDFACFAAGEEATYPPIPVNTGGVHQLAIGRDSAASSGDMGSYDLRVDIRDGYGTNANAALDDVPSQASGAECP